MGMDLDLYFTSTKEYTDAEIQKLNYRFNEACSLGYGNAPISKSRIGNITVFSVCTMSRYYGKCYSSGNFESIYMAILWLEANIENCKVYYGADSPFEDCYELTEDNKKELFQHWAMYGGTSYYQRTPKEEQFRILCQNCSELMTEVMSKGDTTRGLECLGCDNKLITEDSGATWQKWTR